MYHDITIDGNDSPTEAFNKLTAEPTGYTIARTARILDMSRQSVDAAIRKGALRATRIYAVTKKGKSCLSVEVDRESVQAYANARNGRQRVPQGYLNDQHELALS